ncbi:hypothetical protein [Brevibacillus agri]|uniref:hypothetical protein n=1 Tax=Brevibacillus agri TaxID=51101 RepID=UPI003D223D14
MVARLSRKILAAGHEAACHAGTDEEKSRVLARGKALMIGCHQGFFLVDYRELSSVYVVFLCFNMVYRDFFVGFTFFMALV